jgi:hypothetical protein
MPWFPPGFPYLRCGSLAFQETPTKQAWPEAWLNSVAPVHGEIVKISVGLSTSEFDP